MFTNGDETILPLSIELLGGRSRPWIRQAAGVLVNDQVLVGRGSSMAWDSDNLGQPLQTLFDGFPLLYVTDSMLLQPCPSLKIRTSRIPR